VLLVLLVLLLLLTSPRADLLPLSQALLTNQAVVTNYDPTYGDVFTGT